MMLMVMMTMIFAALIERCILVTPSFAATSHTQTTHTLATNKTKNRKTKKATSGRRPTGRRRRGARSAPSRRWPGWASARSTATSTSPGCATRCPFSTGACCCFFVCGAYARGCVGLVLVCFSVCLQGKLCLTCISTEKTKHPQPARRRLFRGARRRRHGHGARRRRPRGRHERAALPKHGRLLRAADAGRCALMRVCARA